MFYDYLMLGFDHILDTNGYDHILFVTVLCALYDPSDWKKILILVTAFTIGHSLTLALAALNIVKVNPTLVETLIPITIILTGVFNIFMVMSSSKSKGNVSLNYVLAGFFGLIHGLGFSNYFRAILGKEESIVKPLLAFNVGVEVGQIIMVTVILVFSYLFVFQLKTPKKMWTLTISAVGIYMAAYLLGGK
jgi:hypothetical protein